MIKLALFDVDGTLIEDGSFHGRFQYALKKVFGVDLKPGVVAPTGLTDPGTVKYLAIPSGVAEETYMQNIDKVMAAELEYVASTRDTEKITLRPGVLALLTELKSRGVKLVLVTGSTTAMARIKLEKAGVFNMFDMGSFGDQIMNRNELIQIALRKYREKFGEIASKEIMYFGDTPYDVEGAHAAGLRIIATGTKRHSASELASLGAEFPFDDMSDTNKILQILDS
ncbi:MAG TPA: HAD hydrolase-like protein [Candidatus Baltobacteraceae bacterium]|nr:HAD hydrolase-like protein [Candidatus Baltobacteraceae bacterium]